MSCNYPLVAVRGDLQPSGKYKYIPHHRYDSTVRLKPDEILIPCGKCLGCRADYTRQWADRMILELDHSKKAIFLTLTYDNDHLPVLYQVTTGQSEMTLQKRDMQLFFKRLRKRFPDREIRTYYTGEYGLKSLRPHYHAIIYGIGLDDFEDLRPQGINELGQSYFVSDLLAEKVWKCGFCLLADVTWKSCAYVARYVRKKQFGLVSDEFIDRIKQPVFCESSRRPGIGMYYPLEHPDFADQSKYYFSDSNGSVTVGFPRAFLCYLENNDPERFEQLKRDRKEFSDDFRLLQLSQTDLSSSELGELSEKQIISSSKILDRSEIF